MQDSVLLALTAVTTGAAAGVGDKAKQAASSARETVQGATADAKSAASEYAGKAQGAASGVRCDSAALCLARLRGVIGEVRGSICSCFEIRCQPLISANSMQS